MNTRAPTMTSILLFYSLAFVVPPAFADNLTLRIGAGHPTTGFAYVQAVDNYFIPEVTKRAKAQGYNVTFIKAWAGSVAKVDGIIDAVQRGVLDIGLCLPTFEPGKADIFNFSFYAPFGPSDPK
jgi:ABC-type sugar transport system substrate-binding protein